MLRILFLLVALPRLGTNRISTSRLLFLLFVVPAFGLALLVVGLSGSLVTTSAAYAVLFHHNTSTHHQAVKPQPKRVVPKGQFVRFTSVNGPSEKTSLRDGCLQKTKDTPPLVGLALDYRNG